ncbi:hypothetical protein B0H13DRAFT_1888594 [Mycena leptocephala]|nr:hypothetical protein B0H13DRAFT_1888594 [Mycena leptocephala]
MPEEREKDAWGTVSRQKKMIQSRPRTRSYGSSEVTDSFIFVKQVRAHRRRKTEEQEPEDKIQSREIKDFGHAGLTETLSGRLQKVGDRSIVDNKEENCHVDMSHGLSRQRGSGNFAEGQKRLTKM